jgi:hypothetical protein
MIAALLTRALAYALALETLVLVGVWYVYVPIANANAVALALAENATAIERAAARRADSAVAVLVAASRDASTVQRVRERVRTLCQPARLPTATGGAADPAAETAHDDAEFADAVEEDLATCQAELARFSALQAWHDDEAVK